MLLRGGGLKRTEAGRLTGTREGSRRWPGERLRTKLVERSSQLCAVHRRLPRLECCGQRGNKRAAGKKIWMREEGMDRVTQNKTDTLREILGTAQLPPRVSASVQAARSTSSSTLLPPPPAPLCDFGFFLEKPPLTRGCVPSVPPRATLLLLPCSWALRGRIAFECLPSASCSS